MTESEIMKALKECEDCHLFNECEKSTRLALDLINRKNDEIKQKDDEIKQKDDEIDCLTDKVEGLSEVLYEAKAEAIKEYKERVKAKHRRITDYDEAGFGCQIFIVEENIIDQIAKEMGVEL